MKKACFGLALLAALAVPLALCAADEVLEVDLGASEPTATPVPPTATPVPPTEVPTLVPTVTVLQTPVAVVTVAAADDLGKVHFSNGAAAADAVSKGGSEDGLMIIAPGAASPEDSLESFGIDSPYNWKNRDRKTLKPGSAADDEALELGAPESSDLRDQVQVENGAGDSVGAANDYDQVERAGLLLAPAEYRVDGRVGRITSGGFFAVRGGQVALRMEPGRQVYPGSIYTAFREAGPLRGSGADAKDVGMLIRNTGVLKVIRIEGEEVLAKVLIQYDIVKAGDLVRLRDPDRLRYYNSLRQGGKAPLQLKGEVLGVMPPKMVAVRGDVVFVDFGRQQGAWPGMRLLVSRDAESPDSNGMLPLKQTGRLGQLELLQVSREASVARVIAADGIIRRGDKVRYR